MARAGAGGKPASDQGFRGVWAGRVGWGRGISYQGHAHRVVLRPAGGRGRSNGRGFSMAPPPTNVTAPRPRPRAGVSLLPSPAGAAGEPGVARWSRGPFRCAPHGRWPRGGAGGLGGRLRQGAACGSAAGGLPPSRFPPGPGEAARVPELRAARARGRAGGRAVGGSPPGGRSERSPRGAAGTRPPSRLGLCTRELSACVSVNVCVRVAGRGVGGTRRAGTPGGRRDGRGARAS